MDHHESAVALLTAAISAAAVRDGRNLTAWPGLTVYRLGVSARPAPEDSDGPAVCVLRLPAGGLGYTIGDRGFDIGAWATVTSPHDPVLALMLRLDPQLIRSVAGAVRAPGRSAPTGEPVDGPAPSALDPLLADGLLRFLRSVLDPADRRALAPLYLQEVVYRVLQGGHGPRLLQLAARQTTRQPVAAALTYISDNLADALTVDVLAAQVNLSPSAFSRTFRMVTGRPPYQYVKGARLEQARILLDAGRYAGVADVARAVGYASVSHFIKEFRARFGTTPGEYLGAQRICLEVPIAPVA